MAFSSRALDAAVIGALLCLGTARADTGSPEDHDAGDATAPEADSQDEIQDEMIVFGDMEVARTRGNVDKKLQQLGYNKRKRKEGKTVYRPDLPWEASVVVYDEGFMLLRRSPVRFEPPGKGDSRLRYLYCLPPFTPMCLRIGGQVVSKRRLAHSKATVAYRVHPELRAWNNAVVARAMEMRVNEDVPDLLDGIWQHGNPDNEPVAVLQSRPERREAILGFWASRSCTPQGDQVRVVVEDFLAYEVQQSSWPATRAEVEHANASTTCMRRLDPAELFPEPLENEGPQGHPNTQTEFAGPEEAR